MKTVIITEGSKGAGYGHLMRCLSLYQAFEESGTTPSIIADCDDLAGHHPGPINLAVLDWRRNLTELLRRSENSDVVVVDSYLADAHIYEQLAAGSRRIAYLDDYLRIGYPPGVIVNGTAGAERLPYPCGRGHEFLLGLDFAPVRKEFWDATPRSGRSRIENVLLMFGADDPRNLTGRILNCLLRAFPDYRYHVVSSRSSGDAESTSDLRTTRIYRNLPASELLPLMLKCDLAITAAGQTTVELARLAVPTIAIGVAENQSYSLRGWIEAGFLESELWWHDVDLMERLVDEIRAKVNHGPGTSPRGDGQGPRRIVRYLSE